MEITEVKVFILGEDKLKAFVSVVLDHCFMVNDIKVIQGRDGLFISMPSRRKKNGEFKDVAHPLNNETRRWLESAILETYERELAAQGESVEEARERGELRARPLSRQPDAEAERSESVSPRRSLWSAV